jgi:hypothetical protein
LLGHVKDLGRSSTDPNARIYQTRERQTHHTDSCDVVVGLLCLSRSASVTCGDCGWRRRTRVRCLESMPSDSVR